MEISRTGLGGIRQANWRKLFTVFSLNQNKELAQFIHD